jgi:hypothetical protein
MATVMRAFGLFVVGLVAMLVTIPVALFIAYHFGVEPLFVLMATAGTGAAWAGHTDESKRVRDQVRRALAAINMADKEAAYRAGITPGQFAQQLAGHEHLSAYRLAAIGPEFRAAFARIQAEDEGFTVARDSVLSQVLTELPHVLEDLRGLVRRDGGQHEAMGAAAGDVRQGGLPWDFPRVCSGDRRA